MNLYDQPIEARINWLFSHAKRHAESFASPETPMMVFCCWRPCPTLKSALTAPVPNSRHASCRIFAAEVITRLFPQLAEKMHRRTAVLNWESRKLELLG